MRSGNLSKPSLMGFETSADRAGASNRVRGPIIISRHGRPALDRSAGPPLTWQEYCEWWESYEVSKLAEGQEVPTALIEAVSDVDLVLSSVRQRAIETARRATKGREPEQYAVFNEAPQPPPCLKNRKYMPKTWNVLARIVWLAGHSLDGESVKQARKRARKAAETLHEVSDGKIVYLAAHGWFNRMIRRPLQEQGWVCVRDGADGYWSYRVYEYRGKS